MFFFSGIKGTRIRYIRVPLLEYRMENMILYFYFYFWVSGWCLCVVVRRPPTRRGHHIILYIIFLHTTKTPTRRKKKTTHHNSSPRGAAWTEGQTTVPLLLHGRTEGQWITFVSFLYFWAGNLVFFSLSSLLLLPFSFSLSLILYLSFSL